MDNRKKRLLGMGFVVAVLFAASMLAFQMQKAAPAAAPAQPAGQKLPIIMYHNISPNAGRQGKYTVSVKEFEGDLKYQGARLYSHPDSTADRLCQTGQVPAEKAADDYIR